MQVTSLGIPLVPHTSTPIPEDNPYLATLPSLKTMLQNYVEGDQLNAILEVIDSKISSLQSSLADAGLGPAARPQIHQPIESPDGNRQTFSFDALPDDPSAFLLVWGGIVQSPGNDFSVSGGVVTMIQVPKANDNLFAFY